MSFTRTLASVALAAMLAPAAAMATTDTPQDKAQDKQGRPIMDARGNCVQTKWQTSEDICGAQEAKKELFKMSREARTVYFDFNKSTLKASEKAKLDNLIRALRGAKEVTSVDIVGHADEIGSNSYNQQLSRRRAQTVRSYLAASGVKTRKIDVRALGESQPVTKCADTLPREERIACLAADRRVEIEFNYAQ